MMKRRAALIMKKKPVWKNTCSLALNSILCVVYIQSKYVLDSKIRASIEKIMYIIQNTCPPIEHMILSLDKVSD